MEINFCRTFFDLLFHDILRFSFPIMLLSLADEICFFGNNTLRAESPSIFLETMETLLAGFGNI